MIRWLIHKHNLKEINNIRPIHYRSNNMNKTKDQLINNSSTTSTTFHNKSNTNSESIEIHIDPKEFKNKNSTSLNTINNKWFLSGILIPKDIQCLLQLGDNFALPTTNKKTMTFVEDLRSVGRSCKSSWPSAIAYQLTILRLRRGRNNVSLILGLMTTLFAYILNSHYALRNLD